MKQALGFIGLGLMGQAMAMRFQEAGYKLFLYNRTKSKSDSLVAGGATWCDSPADVARNVEFVFSMISDDNALRTITIEASGTLESLAKESVHIDMSTVSPFLTKELATKFSKRGVHFLHVPVLGSIPNIQEGSLLLFVGGEEGAFKRAEPLLRILGNRIWQFPSIEQASHMKLICNSFIAGMIVTLTQAIVYSTKVEIDPSTMLDILRHSALNSTMYQTKGKAIIEGNFKPRFFVEHMLKDITLALQAANAVGASMPGLETAKGLFERAMKAGLAKSDYSAIVEVMKNS